LAVIVPALNEEDTIAAVVARVPFPSAWVTVVDNGSTDATAARAASAGAHVVLTNKRGYGAACLAGMAANPDADIFVFIDADLSENPEDIPALIKPILHRHADLVLGARRPRFRPWHVRVGTTLCLWLINRLWGTHYVDLGPFRAVRASALGALAMTDETWGWTIEMQVRAAESQLRWLEIPVASGPRLGGRSKISGSVVGSARAAYCMLEIIAWLWWTARRRLTPA
jgi:glycosyltransferase involved in cell wall biosynthesis